MSSLTECLRSGTTVAFLTGGCFCLNCAGLIFYTGGLIRGKTLMGKAFGYGWIFDIIFGLECVLNGISDLVLLAAVSYHTRDPREGFPAECLSSTLKGFIVWNTFSVVACWTASCALHYERDLEFGGIYPYAMFNESALASNATGAALVNKNFIPTLAMLYITATLTAAFKLLVLYSVYFGYLKVVLHDAMLADPFVAYARECDTSRSSEGPGYYGGGHAGRHGAAPIPSEWGHPSRTSFRPRSEWSSSQDTHNPFAENVDERLAGHQVISSPQSSYPLDRWTSPRGEDPLHVPYVAPGTGPTANGHGCPPIAPAMSVPPAGPVAPAMGMPVPQVPTSHAPPFTPPPPITGPPAHQPIVQTPHLPPPIPTAVPAGPPMPSPLPTTSATVSVPPSIAQPRYPTPQPPAVPTPSLPPILPAQAPQLVQVQGDVPLEQKRRRRVSISGDNSVTTFSPSDAAANVGGQAQAYPAFGESRPSSSIDSVASTLNRLLDNVAAGLFSSRGPHTREA